MPDAPRRFLIATDFGDVVVSVRPGVDGLASDLLELSMADAGVGEALPVATPLRAFAAKMVDIIEAQGLTAFAGGERLREMLVREKATAELKRIEHYAREHAVS
ncbi:MAG: hypothetical protein P8Z81_04805 [Deinococcales bacterium]